MIVFKIAAGLIFNLLGILVVYRGVRNARLKGIGDGIIEMASGVGFIIIGLLIWFGFIG